MASKAVLPAPVVKPGAPTLTQRPFAAPGLLGAPHMMPPTVNTPQAPPTPTMTWGVGKPSKEETEIARAAGYVKPDGKGDVGAYRAALKLAQQAPASPALAAPNMGAPPVKLAAPAASSIPADIVAKLSAFQSEIKQLQAQNAKLAAKNPNSLPVKLETLYAPENGSGVNVAADDWRIPYAQHCQDGTPIYLAAHVWPNNDDGAPILKPGPWHAVLANVPSDMDPSLRETSFAATMRDRGCLAIYQGRLADGTVGRALYLTQAELMLLFRGTEPGADNSGVQASPVNTAPAAVKPPVAAEPDYPPQGTLVTYRGDGKRYTVGAYLPAQDGVENIRVADTKGVAYLVPIVDLDPA